MKIKLTLVLILYISSATLGQTLFNKRYGTNHRDYGSAITSTLDGGFAVAGTTEGAGASGDIFLMKLNQQGTLEWTKRIFGVNQDWVVAVFQLSNGDYVIGGRTYSYGLGCYSALLVKLDSIGNLIWAKTYGDINCNYISCFSQTNDGGYVACGVPVGGGTPAWIFKTDSDGVMQWSKTYQNCGALFSVKQTPDGGFIAVAYQGGIFLLKVDSIGNVQWFKGYILSTGNTQSFDLQVLENGEENGDIIITGEVYYNAIGAEPDIYLLKVDANGNRIWFKTYGYTFFEYGLSVKPTFDQGFIIAGKTNSFGHGDYDAVLLKADANGDLVWAKTYGDSWPDEADQVQILPDSGFVFTGLSYVNSTNQDSSLIYVVRTDKDGITSCGYMDWTPIEQTQLYDPTIQTTTVGTVAVDSACYPTVFNMSFFERDLCSTTDIEELKSDFSINIYPNPATSNSSITFTYTSTSAQKQIVINDINGREVARYTLPQWSSAQHLKLPQLSSGIYIARLTGGEAGANVKFVVE